MEFEVVWRAQGFDQIPLILDVPSVGATFGERAEVEARVWGALVERELADDHGRADAGLVGVLGVIAHRGQSLHLRVFGRDAVRAMVATRGRRAVLARLDGERFRVGTVAGTGLIGTLLSVVPDVAAGRGHSVSVAVEVFAAAARAGSPAVAWDVLARNGMNRADARVLVEMTTGSVRMGQIAAEVRTRGGRMVRAERVVAFHDTGSGRYQAVRAGGQLTVAPASRAMLVRGVSELVGELRERD